jgi:hypothetical protein
MSISSSHSQSCGESPDDQCLNNMALFPTLLGKGELVIKNLAEIRDTNARLSRNLYVKSQRPFRTLKSTRRRTSASSRIL